MMNQYYGFSGRGGRSGYDRAMDRGYDRSPYRRPMGRSGMPDRGMYPYGSTHSPRDNGGCGCGLMNQDTARPFDRSNGEAVPHRQNRAVPVMNNGCGCGSHAHHNDNENGHYHDNGNCHGNGNCRDNGNCQDNGHCHDNGNCNGRDNTACNRLMEQIRAVDFALYETVLYLDVYPNSCDALETYHKLKAQSKALHEEYESACSPLTAFGNQSTTSWDWMSKPFPWEYDAD